MRRYCLPALVLLLAMSLATATAQPDPAHTRYSYDVCDPSASALQNAAHACDFIPMSDGPSVATTHRAIVAQLYVSLARGDDAALRAALNDDVVWTSPVARHAGRQAATKRLRALLGGAAPVLASEGADRVVATSPVPGGAPVRIAWQLQRGRIVGAECLDPCPALASDTR